MPLLLATHSEAKVRELRRLAPELAHATTLREAGITAVAEEPGATFEENARRKAAHYATLAGTPALADDSGICLAAWGGAPGVRSARLWPELSWPERLERLCREAQGAAWFACCLAIELPEGGGLLVRGEVHGTLATSPRGSAGFGYDPVFVPAGEHRTLAELGAEDKDRVSHRARAFAALREQLLRRPDLTTRLR